MPKTKDEYMAVFYKTLLHTFEVAVLIAATYLLVHLFNLEVKQELVTLTLVALAKLSRATVFDYVND